MKDTTLVQPWDMPKETEMTSTFHPETEGTEASKSYSRLLSVLDRSKKSTERAANYAA